MAENDKEKEKERTSPEKTTNNEQQSLQQKKFSTTDSQKEIRTVTEIPDLHHNGRNLGLKEFVKIFSDEIFKSKIKEISPDIDVNTHIVIEQSSQIEKEIWEFAENDYMKHLRTRILLLKDKNNPNLKVSVFLGTQSIEDFAQKPVDELNSEEQKKKREAGAEWTAKAMDTGFMMNNMDAKDSEFTCNKCGKKKIMTSQKQMRSADEPMTTFLFCITCGNRWKMN